MNESDFKIAAGTYRTSAQKTLITVRNTTNPHFSPSLALIDFEPKIVFDPNACS